MGNPLSSTIADLVMETLETNTIKKLNSPLGIYKRYVDDIFLTCNKNEIDAIVKEFNSFHPKKNSHVK